MNEELGTNEESVSVQEKQSINTDMGRGVTNMSNKQTETDTERTELENKVLNGDLDEVSRGLGRKVYNHILNCQSCLNRLGNGQSWFNSVEVDLGTGEISCTNVENPGYYNPIREGRIQLKRVGDNYLYDLIRDIDYWERDEYSEIHDDIHKYSDNNCKLDGLNEEEKDSVHGIELTLSDNLDNWWTDEIKNQLKVWRRYEETRY